MAELNFVFDSVSGDRVYNSQSYADYYKTYFSTGVVGLANNLSVTLGTGNNVILSAGKAIIEGRYYENTANLTLPVATTSTTRVDRVILRLDTNVAVRSIKAYVVQGTATMPPTLTRTGTIYELSLCKINVTSSGLTLTDERDNLTVCGTSGILTQVKPVGYGDIAYTDTINAGSTLTKTIPIGNGKTKGIATISSSIGGIIAHFGTNGNYTKVTGYEEYYGGINGTANHRGSAWSKRGLGSITKAEITLVKETHYLGINVTGAMQIRINDIYIDGTNIKIVFQNIDTVSRNLNCTIDWEVE